MPKQIETGQRSWFAVHTYAGYEDNVARNLTQRIESLGFENKIFNVLVPKEKIRIKSGKRETIEEKIYPGYVLVEMIVDDASWYVVRNTPNVTGFIGAGTVPTRSRRVKLKFCSSGWAWMSRNTRLMWQWETESRLPMDHSRF